MEEPIMKPDLHSRKWWLFFVLVLVSFALGMFGRWKFLVANGEYHRFSDLIYYSLALFHMHDGNIHAEYLPIELDIARFMSPLLMGIFIGAVFTMALFKKEFLTWMLRFKKEHAIICGLGEAGKTLATQLIKSRQKVVVIDIKSDEESESFCDEHGILLIGGNGRETGIWNKANARNANKIIIATGSNFENVQILSALHNMPGGTVELVNIQCLVHIDDIHVRRLLETKYSPLEIKKTHNVAVFNIYDSCAKSLLWRENIFLNRLTNGILKNDDNVRILIVGLGKTGESVLIRLANYYKILRAAKGEIGELIIKIIDRNASSTIEHLEAKYPFLRNYCKTEPLVCEVPFSRGFTNSENVLKTSDGGIVDIVYVCVSDVDVAFTIGIALQKMAREINSHVPIYTKIDPLDKSAKQVDMGLMSANCHFFSMIDGLSFETIGEVPLEDIARAGHDAYVYNQLRNGKTVSDSPNMVDWNELTPEFQKSNMEQAKDILNKLASSGYAPMYSGWGAIEGVTFLSSEIEQMAKDEHIRWWDEKRKNGWQPGSIRNDEKKLHPSMVEWDKLSDEEKNKDRDPIKRISACLAMLGYEITRINPPASG